MTGSSADEYRLGYLIGEKLSLAVPVVLFLYFLYRAIGASSRSRRLANLALCGAFANASLLQLDVLGGLEGLSGLAGMALAVVALVVRRRDRGTGLVRPILALVLSALTLLASAGRLLLPTLIDRQRDRGRIALEEPGADARRYRFVEHDFQLTLPSPRWSAGPTSARPSSNLRLSFTHPSRTELSLEASPRRTEGAFVDAASELASWFDKAIAPARATHARGLTPKGCHYASATAMGRNKRYRRFFLVRAVIWCADKQFTTMGSGEGTLISLSFDGEPGKLVTEALLGRTSQFILDSVEDGS